MREFREKDGRIMSAELDNDDHDPLFEETTPEQIGKVIGRAPAFRFTCTKCGACCRGPGSVYFSKEDLEHIASHLGYTGKKRRNLEKSLIQEEENGYYVHAAGGACLFLDDDDRCTIYPVRPMQCRTFPFWPSTFASKAGLESVKTECPGTMSKKGEAFTNEETARRVNETRSLFLKEQRKKKDHFMI